MTQAEMIQRLQQIARSIDDPDWMPHVSHVKALDQAIAQLSAPHPLAKRCNSPTGNCIASECIDNEGCIYPTTQSQSSPSVEQARKAVRDAIDDYIEGGFSVGIIETNLDALIAAVRADRDDALQATIDRLTTINQRLEAEAAVRAERAQEEPTVDWGSERIQAMVALDAYLPDEGLAKSTSLVFRIRQLGHALQAHPVSGGQDGSADETHLVSGRDRAAARNALGVDAPASEVEVAAPRGITMDKTPHPGMNEVDPDYGLNQAIPVAAPPAGTRERIIEAARNQWATGPQAIEDRMPIAAACEALTILRERVLGSADRARFAKIEAYDGLLDAILLVDKLKAELTPPSQEDDQ